MKKNILKIALILIALLIIIFALFYKKKHKFVYVENKKEHVCQKCVIIDNQYYCQTFGVKESKGDK